MHHSRTRSLRNLLIGGVAAATLVLTGCSGSAIGGSTGDEVEASPGITDTEIHIGVTYPFSGALSAYGAQYKGAQAYIDYVNEELGGVTSADGKTRKIVLETGDDQYDPAKALEQVRKLVENDGVFAIAGVVGTPSNSAIIDYLNENDVPHVFAATGASKWGATPDVYPWSIGFQPAYTLESAAYVQYLEDNQSDATVAILYQNDDYGKDFLKGFKAAVEQSDSDIEIVAEESYETSDTTLDSQMARLAASGATAVNLITTPKFAAQALQYLYASSWDPETTVVASPAASISSTIQPIGTEKAQGIITALYFKDPADPQWDDDEGMQFYKDIMTKYSDVEDVSENMPVHGFNHFYALVEALKLLKEPTRQGLMDAVLSLDHVEHPMLVPGSTVNTGPDDRFPVETLMLQQFEGDHWKIISDALDFEGQTAGLSK